VNPIEMIEQARIPVLAIWVRRTRRSIQSKGRTPTESPGASRQPNYRLEVLPGADHMPGVSQTGCVSETEQTFERVLQAKGTGR